MKAQDCTSRIKAKKLINKYTKTVKKLSPLNDF